MSNYAFDTGGSPIVVAVQAQDGTGFAITTATAGTPVIVKNALFAEVQNTSNGGLTFDVATGVVTVASPAGIGKYRVDAIVSDAIGVSGKGSILNIFASEAGASAAAVGTKARFDEATAVRDTGGACIAFVDLSAEGDTVELRNDQETNGDATTFHGITLVLTKIGGV